MDCLAGVEVDSKQDSKALYYGVISDFWVDKSKWTSFNHCVSLPNIV